MHFWKVSNTRRTVGILLFDAFSNMCLANAVEPFRAANMLARKQLYRWDFLSLDGSVATSSSGLPVQPCMPLHRHLGGDYLFVMPSYGYKSLATGKCSRSLRAARERFQVLVGMDTGSWLLASAGLLDGRNATIHWDEHDTFAETFPEVQVSSAPVVEDGPILTCGGVTTSLDLTLNLIENHHGPMLRLEVASLFVNTGKSKAYPRGQNSNGLIEDVVSAMRRNVEDPLPIAELCGLMDVSQKRLEQVCAHRLGLSPRRLYLGIRLREARRFLENTTLSISEIADRCGYQNASAMARAFKSEFGVTPTDHRQSLTRYRGSTVQV